MGNNDEALKWYNKALAIREKVLPSEHPDLAISYNTIGSIYSKIGDDNEAMKSINKALVTREKVPNSVQRI